MNTNKKERAFDCVKMKNDIQAKIYAETKNMNTTELLEYFNGGNILTRQPNVRRHLKFHYSAVQHA